MLLLLHLFGVYIFVASSDVYKPQLDTKPKSQTRFLTNTVYRKPIAITHTHRRTTGLNFGGNYNGASHNWQAGVGLNHNSGQNSYGLDANYNSADRGLNVGANANFHNNVNVGAGYNTANKAIGANVKINFRRGMSPATGRYANPEAVVGRKLLQKDIQFLHKTIGSRHVEMLKVNLSDSIDPQTYTSKDLIRELRCIQSKLGESFPQLCTFMLKLTKNSPCNTLTTVLPTESDQMNFDDVIDLTELKTFSAKLIYGEQMLKKANSDMS